MKTRNLILGLFTATSFAMAGTVLAQSSTAPAQAPMQNGAAQQLDGDDKDFLENAAQSGHAEIEGSKLALSKATSPEVKEFAQMMIDDHTKVGQELTTLATTKGYTPPTEPSLLQRTMLKALSVMDDSFDRRYANQIGVSAHEDAVKLFQDASANAKDPEIKAFATKHLPALEQHLQQAKALQQKVAPSSATTTDQSAPSSPSTGGMGTSPANGSMGGAGSGTMGGASGGTTGGGTAGGGTR